MSHQRPLIFYTLIRWFLHRCVHSVSDAHRVSSFDFSGLESCPKKKPQSTELIVLVGLAGSGVTVLTSNLAAQLKTQSNNASSVPQIITLDFAELSPTATSEEVDRFLAQRLVRSQPASERAVLLVSVVQSVALYFPLQSLLTLVAIKLDAEPSVVLSMLVPSSLDLASRTFKCVLWCRFTFLYCSQIFVFLSRRYASKSASETGHGLGQELWQAVGLSDALQGGAVDVLLLVDEPTAGPDSSANHRAFQSQLALINPTAQILKLSPNNLRLDQEGLDLVLSIVQSSHSTAGVAAAATERQAWACSRGVPRHNLLDQLSAESSTSYLQTLRVFRTNSPPMVGIGLTTVHLRPSAEWNLRSVLHTIQLIFPSARLSSSVAEDTWKVPVKRNTAADVRTRFFQRVIQLAKAKVMSARQEEEGRRVYQQTVARLSKGKVVAGKGEEEVLQRLIRGVRSVHGVLLLPSGSVSVQEPQSASPQRVKPQSASNAAFLEGNSNFAVLRAIPPSSGSHHEVGLMVQGVLGKLEITLLEELFAACTQFKLLPKPLLNLSDVNITDRLRVQSTEKYASRCELPGNWWYDGQSYVDISGTRRPLRPDIDRLVELFLLDENAKIAEYNALLKEI